MTTVVSIILSDIIPLRDRGLWQLERESSAQETYDRHLIELIGGIYKTAGNIPEIPGCFSPYLSKS